ncbi:tyrosine-type recombinase/integrase [Haliangium sp. UPWRP_2]|uniref:tyrosine-type recombinase/integrase n=1 Tax=Haliangium sp. UPWRP_2 TaxID=1931276 RepID=UPI000B53D19C|nr:tyrosine-type recombinase/integrase [Haliangium sp. UPWRP_2]PSM31775.1 hypothetical protein BVG81_003615 [Haliangium sp. UPWRP_2]
MNAPNKRLPKKTKRTLSFLGKPLVPSSLHDEEPKKQTAVRVSGPYYDANVGTYRLVVFDGSSRKSLRANSEEEAIRLKAHLERILRLGERTIGDVLAEFVDEKRKQGIRERSLSTVEFKLRSFLPLEQVLNELSPEHAQAIYEAETKRVSRFKRPVQTQTHQSELRLAKHFFRWAVERKYIASSPFEKVKPIGKANVGKEQLRIDEARRLTLLLVEAAERDEDGAVEVLCQLLLGLRSGEVLARQVRDLDDEGKVLWIPCGKTQNARRRLEVPEVLRPFLLQRAIGQPPERLLFGGHRNHPYKHMRIWRQVRKYCLRANVQRMCPHSLRGLHSSLALAAGCTSSAVASALGHGSFAITAKHYVDPDTLRNSTVRRVAGALTLAAKPEDESAQLLERLRSLPAEVRSALLRAVAAETAN